MASFRSGAVRGLRTRSLSFTSLSDLSDNRGRSRSPIRKGTEAGNGWQRLKGAISCKERLQQLHIEEEAWKDGQCAAEAMPRTASPSPERWLHAQCITPCAHVAVFDVSEQWQVFAGHSAFGASQVHAPMVAATPMQSFGVHGWEQQQFWEQPQFAEVTPPVPFEAPIEQVSLQLMDAHFNFRFGPVVDLVQDARKAIIVDAISAELQSNDSAERQALILWLAPSSAELSLTSSGTRLVQAALDLAQGASWKALIEMLVPRAVDLSRSRHGNFALQKMAVRMNRAEAIGLIKVLSGYVQEIAQQTYGCRTFERLIEHFSDPELTPILDELLVHVREFAEHKHANYAISAIIEHGNPERRKQVIDALVPHASVLAMNRVATHVLERALRCGEEVQSRCVTSWLSCDSPSILEMALSKFGSYLLADFAKMSSERNRAQVRSVLAPSLAHLQSSDEGCRIVAAYGLSQ